MPSVQVVEALAGVATTRPAGRLSVKSRPPAASTLALLSMLKTNVVGTPTPVTSGMKVLSKSGGGSIWRLAMAGDAITKPDWKRSLVAFT